MSSFCRHLGIGTVTKLKRFYFLIHGFCYTEMTRGAEAIDPKLLPYLLREETCAKKWRARLFQFAATDALVVIPTHPGLGESLKEYLKLAELLLGDRVFVLDCPDALSPAFWQQGDDFNCQIVAELQGAFVQQQLRCNNEEMVTHLHCLACARQFKQLLTERGYSFDAATVLGKAWGASFEGCVTKYTNTLRYLLGLANPIAINFNLTVPDAPFLLNIFRFTWIEQPNGTRLYVFKIGKEGIALFTTTSHSMADEPLFVVLPAELSNATILSKQGIQLWPEPELYELITAPPEYREPAQELVTLDGDKLKVPVSSGFVYRLAKAPAYIFPPEGVGYWEFVWLLRQEKSDRCCGNLM